MTSNEILSELKALSSEKYKANVVKLGIPETCSIGVSTADVRKLAKKAGRDNFLAHELMENGNKAQKWIGKDALKELEKLVKTEGRSRLISADSQMGKEIK